MVYTMLMTLIPTIIIEYAVLMMLGEKRKKVLCTSVSINIMTNIPLCLFLMDRCSPIAEIAMAEAIVVLVEAICYWAITKSTRLSIVYSLLCNAISYFAGLLAQTAYRLIVINT